MISWPHTSIKCGSTLECGLLQGQWLCHHNQWAGVSSNKARCGTQSCGTRTSIRSVASDCDKRTNNSKGNNLESLTVTSTTSNLDACLSHGLLHPHLHTQETHEEIPFDVLGKGRLVKNKHTYRQIFVIRSYEVGFDKTTPIDTIFNLFQETSLNHVGMLNFVGDGMGTTHAMIQNRLIWIVTRMHIEMARYPFWGDVVEIDSWVSSSGKNGMRRDFLVRDYNTGFTLGRATSNWAMMNQDTRRLSKMPEEVRAEISPHFVDRSVMSEDDDALKRIPLLDDSASFKSTGLVPKVHDLDMNQHVNHVKYINWVLQSLPQSMMMSCELSRVTLEYRRECGSSDAVESLAQPEMASSIGYVGPMFNNDGPLGFIHLLRLSDTTEVLRGRTQWRTKPQGHLHN